VKKEKKNTIGLFGKDSAASDSLFSASLHEKKFAKQCRSFTKLEKHEQL
jgi:hypothetical protein